MTRLTALGLALMVTLGLTLRAQRPDPPRGPGPQIGQAPAANQNGQRGRDGRGGGRGAPRGRGGLDGFGRMDVPEDNPLTPEKIALGRQLFFDKSLSSDGTVACATCHQPERAFADDRRVAVGVHAEKGTRNSPTLVNAGYSRALFWDGRAATLEQQAMMPLLNPSEMGLTAELIKERAGRSATEVAAALASYVRSIRSRESRFDWFDAGQTNMLTELERTGLNVFRENGCGTCHSGPRFTDDRFHNTGVGWNDGAYADLGRSVVTGDERDRGAFKTPTLRDVALTAPYMHDGSIATLEDVVDFYERGGRRNPGLDPRMRPSRISGNEKKALIAFLNTLTGRIVEGY